MKLEIQTLQKSSRALHFAKEMSSQIKKYERLYAYFCSLKRLLLTRVPDLSVEEHMLIRTPRN
jgi:hypothetical protein